MDLYYHPVSPPCWAVLMAAKTLGVELNLKEIDILNKAEQLSPEFLKINPQHTVPTLMDTSNGLCLSESRAIISYLADKYAKDDLWYPKDPVKRALVNQRLYFDTGSFYGSFWDYTLLKYNAGPDNSIYFFRINSAFEVLNTYLEKSEFVCGDHPTIADISILASITAYQGAPIDISKFPNVSKWFEKTKEVIPGYKDLKDGIQLFIDRIKIMLELAAENNPEFTDFFSGIQIVNKRYNERKNQK